MKKFIAMLLALAVLSGCRSIKEKTMRSENQVMKIVCLGDSITGQPNLRRYLKWSAILECMIEAASGEGSVQVVNRGIGGDTTAGALKRIQNDVLDEKPDIVVILLGGNDAGEKRPPEEVRENLAVIARKCRTAGASVLLMQYHVLPNPDSPETAWAHLDDNNDIIAEVAESEGVSLLDLGMPMTNALGSQRLSELQGRDKNGVATWVDIPMEQEHLASAKDGVHLNPGGELVFARTIFRKMRSLNWIK